MGLLKLVLNSRSYKLKFCDFWSRQKGPPHPLGHAATTTYNDQFINQYGQKVLQITETDPLGLTTITTHDALGHLSTVEKKDLNGQPLTVDEHFYDVTGLHTHHIKDQRPVAAWIYGSMHRLKTLIEGDSRTTQFTYHPTGELHQRIKPNGVILESRYDLAGRLKTIHSSDNTIHYTFRYNKIGQHIEAKDQLTQTTTRRAYDSHSQLKQETLANGLTVSFAYDALGRKSRLHLPDDTAIDYSYDPLYLRAIAYQNLTHIFHSYDLAGNLLEEERIGALGKITHSYDLLGRKQTSSAPGYTQACTFDPSSNVSTLLTNGKLEEFTYDNLYQLSSEKGHHYTYDASGNRISKDTKAQNYDTLNQIHSRDLVYDTQGNLSREYPYSYIYDALDRLIGINTPSGCVHFNYDAYGRLLSKKLNGKKTLYLYDGEKEIGAADTSGKIQQLRILNPTLPSERGAAVLLLINAQAYAPVHDLFGNAKQLLDLNQRLIESYDFTAFGEGNTTGINPWRYASKRSHSETSLIFFGKRFYDPAKGRWLTPDPAGFVDGNNLYLFVCNNPLAKMDLFGLRAEPVFTLSADGTMDIVQFDPIRNLDHQPKEMNYSVLTFDRDYQDHSSSSNSSFFNILQSPRLHGSLQAFGGLVETGVGAGLTLASGGFATPAGFFIMGHGLDQTIAGISTIINGSPRDTVSSQLLQMTGISRENAGLIDGGISVVGSGLGAAGIRATQWGATASRTPISSISKLGSSSRRGENINSGTALRSKLSALQNAQESAAEIRTLPDGRIRYYTTEVLASKPGLTRGASYVTEWNPTTGQVRSWMQSHNHSGQVIRVHPKTINGQILDSVHYPPTGKEIGVR